MAETDGSNHVSLVYSVVLDSFDYSFCKINLILGVTGLKTSYTGPFGVKHSKIQFFSFSIFMVDVYLLCIY